MIVGQADELDRLATPESKCYRYRDIWKPLKFMLRFLASNSADDSLKTSIHLVIMLFLLVDGAFGEFINAREHIES